MTLYINEKVIQDARAHFLRINKAAKYFYSSISIEYEDKFGTLELKVTYRPRDIYGRYLKSKTEVVTIAGMLTERGKKGYDPYLACAIAKFLHRVYLLRRYDKSKVRPPFGSGTKKSIK